MQLSQEAAAERLGVGQNTISEWENGRGLPEGKYWPLLPVALNCDGHWLLTGEGKRARRGADPSVAEAFHAGRLDAIREISKALAEKGLAEKQAGVPRAGISDVDELDRVIPKDHQPQAGADLPSAGNQGK